MTCLDYRRVLLSGDGESAQMKVHRLQCAACAELNREQAVFETELVRGLEVQLPPKFEASLVSRVSFQRRRFLAAAAVSALAVGAGAYAWLGREDPLAMLCIRFVMMDEAKSIMMGSMPRGEAEKVLASTVTLARLESIGQLRHVGPCPFNGSTAYHVVLAVPQGKVTLLVMPDHRLTSRQGATEHGLVASVVSVGEGSVGIVGSDANVVNSVAGALVG